MSQKYSGPQQEGTGLSQEGGLAPEKAKGTGTTTVASERKSTTALVGIPVSLYELVCHLRGSGCNLKTPTNKTDRNTKRDTQSDTVRQRKTK